MTPPKSTEANPTPPTPPATQCRFRTRRPELTQEELEIAAQRKREFDRRAEFFQNQKRASGLINSLPARFAKATYSNYEPCDFAGYQDQAGLKAKQRLAIDAVSEFIGQREYHATEKTGLLLVGTIGTGKDHLAVACLKAVCDAGASALYLVGHVFYKENADAYRLKENAPVSIFDKYTNPDFLLVSDPLETRNWTPGKRDAFARLVADRWNAGRATWITGNLESPAQACEIAGDETWDRLSEHAIVITCKWPTYRQRDRSGRLQPPDGSPGSK